MWRSATVALGALGTLGVLLAACGTPSSPGSVGHTASGAAATSGGPVAQSAPVSTPPTATPPGFPGDGTFAVGTDIRPGTYRTAGASGPSGLSNFYWERDRDLSGTSDSIIANDNTVGPAIVQILPTDIAFKTSGCQAWTMVASAAAPPAGSAPPVAPASPIAPGMSAASVVEAYYAAINAGDYTTAWDLGGKHLSSSYDTFVAGYSNTQRDDVVVNSASGTRVYIDLTAYNRDGTVQHFSGYYVVDGGAITGADIHEEQGS